jgi:single-stranded-DNA-specific exonuclease
LRARIDSGECDYGILIITLENPIDTNLTGLLANQIMAEYGKPTLILNKRVNDETFQITWEGSGRGFATPEVNDWRAYLENFSMYAEGHAMAFGVGFTIEQLHNFITLMTNKKMDITKTYNVDFVFEMSDMFDDKILEIAQYNDIWGTGLTQPMVAIKNVSLKKEDIILQAKGTLKIKLGNHKTTCIKFNSAELYNTL